MKECSSECLMKQNECLINNCQFRSKQCNFDLIKYQTFINSLPYNIGNMIKKNLLRKV